MRREEEPQKSNIDKPIPDKKLLIEAFNQNWLHIRHLENERLHFTHIYAVLVGGILVFGGRYGFDNYIFLVIFMLAYTFLGLIVSIKILIEFYLHMKKIAKVIEVLNLEDYMHLSISYKGILTKIPMVGNAFILFYVTMFLLWLYLLVAPLMDKR
ncbi:hypothetical protein BCF55_1100 [Hydrogenivirga caldilitoris]|uniref:Uncharacterized protein n=2 Tax=Hydrogenivirga caldilitoris TaxID=246264 RepID=A0A497XPD0_9AQUI|nr:hypothetical protein BCF55_1100 [Hydrogenivirga caldilitoris]